MAYLFQSGGPGRQPVAPGVNYTPGISETPYEVPLPDGSAKYFKTREEAESFVRAQERIDPSFAERQQVAGEYFATASRTAYLGPSYTAGEATGATEKVTVRLGEKYISPESPVFAYLTPEAQRQVREGVKFSGVTGAMLVASPSITREGTADQLFRAQVYGREGGVGLAEAEATLVPGVMSEARLKVPFGFGARVLPGGEQAELIPTSIAELPTHYVRESEAGRARQRQLAERAVSPQMVTPSFISQDRASELLRKAGEFQAAQEALYPPPAAGVPSFGLPGERRVKGQPQAPFIPPSQLVFEPFEYTVGQGRLPITEMVGEHYRPLDVVNTSAFTIPFLPAAPSPFASRPRPGEVYQAEPFVIREIKPTTLIQLPLGFVETLSRAAVETGAAVVQRRPAQFGAVEIGVASLAIPQVIKGVRTGRAFVTGADEPVFIHRELRGAKYELVKVETPKGPHIVEASRAILGRERIPLTRPAKIPTDIRELGVPAIERIKRFSVGPSGTIIEKEIGLSRVRLEQVAELPKPAVVRAARVAEGLAETREPAALVTHIHPLVETVKAPRTFRALLPAGGFETQTLAQLERRSGILSEVAKKQTRIGTPFRFTVGEATQRIPGTIRLPFEETTRRTFPVISRVGEAAPMRIVRAPPPTGGRPLAVIEIPRGALVPRIERLPAVRTPPALRITPIRRVGIVKFAPEAKLPRETLGEAREIRLLTKPAMEARFVSLAKEREVFPEPFVRRKITPFRAAEARATGAEVQLQEKLFKDAPPVTPGRQILIPVAEEPGVTFEASRIPLPGVIRGPEERIAPDFRERLGVRQRLEGIPRLVPIERAIQIPRTTQPTRTIPVERTVIIDRTITRPRAIAISREETIQLPRERQRFITQPIPITTTIPITTQVQTQALPSAIPVPPPSPPPRGFVTPPPPFLPPSIQLGIGGPRARLRPSRVKPPVQRYKPSLIAQIFNIKATKAPRLTTGFDVRPVIVKTPKRMAGRKRR